MLARGVLRTALAANATALAASATALGTARDSVRSERNVVVRAATTTTAATTAVATEIFARGRRRVVRAAAALAAFLAATAEELHVVGDDLGDVALVAFLVVVRAGLDATLDVDLAALREILGADLRALAPHDDAVPLGALLALSVLVVPALARREPQLADALPARRVPHVGISAEITDQNDLVD